MKIYFCDGCNESIPITDIQSGQVTTIKGKLFCRKCIPPGSGGSAAPVATGRTGTHPLVVVLLLVLIGYLAWRDLPRLASAVTGDGEAAAELAASDQRAGLSDLDGRLGALATRLDEVERQLLFQRGDVDTVRGSAADLSRSIDQAREELEGLRRGQAETGQLIEKLHFQENRTHDLEGRIDTHAEMLTQLEQRVATGLAERQAGVAQTAAAAPAADATQQAELDAIRRQLLDADAGMRFDAVEKISKGRHKSLATNLVPVLKDEDPFVRIRAMQVLGDFGEAGAVPALFDVLDDPSPPIRKTASETLKRLTGHDAGYDPLASKPERDKAVKKWRELVGTSAATK
ncbi:MAG TPA: HEAT repeat domain-containing protein [Planctomycetota bacterium]|nr:HEAT repeat domain-containing protein [Planctomycetota bacterium]